jgi:hypothetical protein
VPPGTAVRVPGSAGGQADWTVDSQLDPPVHAAELGRVVEDERALGGVAHPTTR